jgi:alkylation response protein AidB-like acyl-CoA dehydrogenase
VDFNLTEQQQTLVEWAKDFAKGQLADDAFGWEQRDSPSEFWAHSKLLAGQGMLGLSIPEELGGGGLSKLDALLVVEAVSSICPYSGGLIRWPIAGPAAFIGELGSKEQQERYLPAIAAGEAAISIAMSEPDAGTASSQLATRATKHDGGFTIQGSKIFISFADRATSFVVYARFMVEGEDRGVGAIIVDRDTPGVEVGEPIHWIGGKVYPLYFEEVEVADEAVLISPTGGKESYKRLMQTYNVERLGGLFELLGVAQLALDRSAAYAVERHQFGKPIAEFQAIQMKLADMAIRLEAARWLTYKATAEASEGRATRKAVSIARVNTTEMVQYVTNEAMQVHGGYGLTREYGLEWLHRVTRHQTVAGGTSEIHRSMIASDVTGMRFDHWR